MKGNVHFNRVLALLVCLWSGVLTWCAVYLGYDFGYIVLSLMISIISIGALFFQKNKLAAGLLAIHAHLVASFPNCVKGPEWAVIPCLEILCGAVFRFSGRLLGILCSLGVALRALVVAEDIRDNFFPVALLEAGIFSSVLLWTSTTREIDVNQQRLAELRETIRQRDELESKFTRHLTREVRTSLAAVEAFATELQGYATSADFDQVQECGGMISSCVNELKSLFNEVLQLRSLDLNSGIPERTHVPFSASDAVEEATRRATPAADEKGIRIVVDTTRTDTNTFFIGDAPRIVQVVYYLIANAVRVTPAGRVVRVYVHAMKSGVLSVDVVDDGELTADIFTTTDCFQPFSVGAGVQLALVRRIVNALGGNIKFKHAKNGRSAEAVLTLQLDTTAEAPATHTTEEQQSTTDFVIEGRPFAGKKILVAEDNICNAKVLRRILVSLGFTVKLAENGQVAFRMVQREDPQFDVALLDIDTPILNGFEAAMKIRQWEHLLNPTGRSRKPSIPIIGMSADVTHATAAFRDKLESAGINDFVDEPTKKHELFAVMQRCLGSRAATGTSHRSRDEGRSVMQHSTRQT